MADSMVAAREQLGRIAAENKALTKGLCLGVHSDVAALLKLVEAQALYIAQLEQRLSPAEWIECWKERDKHNAALREFAEGTK